MSFFRPHVPSKQRNESHHPWEKTIKDTYAQLYKYGHNSTKNPQYPKKEKKEEIKKQESKNRTRVTVIGQRTTKEFIYCYYLIKGLHTYRSKQFETPILRGVTEVEWPTIWNELKLKFGSKAHCITSKVAVIVDDQFLGGENELKKYVESKYVYHLCLDYLNESIQQFANYIEFSGRPCAYMHISICGKNIGTMIFMLYSDVVPRTCENFLRLCETEKGGYAGTPVHRIVKDCWIQCGGYGIKEKSDLGCENFVVPHDRRGVLCMSNAGRHVQCSTQFFVLLEPAPWMQHKYVAFGQLIEGEQILQEIENVPTWFESPTQDIMIYKTGVLNMDCEYAPINKKTHEFVQGHIENLYDLGEWIIQELWKRVSINIELIEQALIDKELAEQTVEGEQEKSVTDDGDTNNDFDVDVYEYETQHSSYFKLSSEPSIPIKPEIPYFIPITDVPYPGEVGSAYNLKRLLDGDYCYEPDLEPDINKNQQKRKQRRLSIPEELVGALFECYDFEGPDDDDDSSDSSTDSDNSPSIQNYMEDNMDHVSFAGPIIKDIANIARKYEVFDEAKTDEVMNRFLTDDELRIIRMAIKEYKNVRQKKVSINLGSSKLSHAKIIRRPTGFIHMEDIAKLVDHELEAVEEEEPDDTSGQKKAVRIMDAMHSDGTKPRMTDMPRESVLMRLLEDVAARDSTDGIPTLKDYKPNLPAAEKPFYLITFSDTRNLKMDDDESPGPSFGNIRPLNQILHLQHGDKIYRKLSTDYVTTINILEGKRAKSVLTPSAYLKRRPWLTVEQYKMKNKKSAEMPAK